MARVRQLSPEQHKKLMSILNNRPIISLRTPIGGLIFHVINYFYGPTA